MLRIKDSQKAQGLVEYAIILGLVAIVVIAVMHLLSQPAEPQCENGNVPEGTTLMEFSQGENGYVLNGITATPINGSIFCYYEGTDAVYNGRSYRIAYTAGPEERLYMVWHDDFCPIGQEVPASNLIGTVLYDEDDIWAVMDSKPANGEWCYTGENYTYKTKMDGSHTQPKVSHKGEDYDDATVFYVDLGVSNPQVVVVRDPSPASEDPDIPTQLVPDLSINMGQFESPKMGYDSGFCDPNDKTYDFVNLTFTTGEFIEVLVLDEKVLVNTPWSDEVPLDFYYTVESKGVVVKNCLGRIVVKGNIQTVSPGIAELPSPTATPAAPALSVASWNHKDYACDLNGYQESGIDSTPQTTVQGGWKDGLFVITANDLTINLDIDLGHGFVHYGLNGPIAPVPSGWDYDFRGESLQIFLTNGDIILVYIPWDPGFPNTVQYKVISTLDDACNH